MIAAKDPESEAWQTLNDIGGIGEDMATDIVGFFAEPHNRKLVDDLLRELEVLDFEGPKASGSKIARKTLGFTRSLTPLNHAEGHQIMRCERHGAWEPGQLEHPLGGGVMFQLYFETIEPALAAASTRAWPIYHELREVWRRAGDQETGQREFFLQDPDGYLIMVAQNLGERPIPGRPT